MNTCQIKTITVEKLFGFYDYSLSLPEEVNDNVFILYGDNGTGKSTILRLIYHMLSTDPGNGHSTYLANVPFKLFEVVFIDGTLVRASRSEDNEELLGEYFLCLQSENEQFCCKIPCTWSEEYHKYRVAYMLFDTNTKSNFYKISEKLREFGICYISDNRINEEVREQEDIRNRRIQHTIDPVEREMNRLHEWIIGQALEASKKGEEGTSEIYVKILTKLGSRKIEDTSMTIEEITKEIDDLANRVKPYAQMGLISNTNYSEVKSKLSRVFLKNREPAANILLPYLEIQKNRLDALDNLFDTISFFINSLNNYLYEKNVYYSVDKGFVFYQTANFFPSSKHPLYHKGEINVKNLSSGERQLLRLFSLVIRNSNSCPIIIIDEPEISLNIKWQRRLLSTLNYFVRNTKVQFIVATHSFELLASHLNSTVKVGNSYIPQNND